MRSLIVLSLMVPAMLLASGAPAQAAQEEPAEHVDLTLVAHSDEMVASGHFTLEGRMERNPDLVFSPGAQVNLTLMSDDTLLVQQHPCSEPDRRLR